MKSIKFLSASFFLIISFVYARVDTSWVNKYDANEFDDYVRAIAVDTIGNVYVTGICKDRHNLSDIVTIKYNTNGIQQWVNRYEPRDTNEYANAIAVDNDGNVYVAGCYYVSQSNDYDYLVVKYDRDGNLVWAETYNGYDRGYDEALAIKIDRSKNVYVTGRSAYGLYGNFDYLTVKYDSTGTLLWASRYRQPAGNDVAIGLVLYGDTVYVTGYSEQEINNPDYLTIKYLPNGDTAWARRYVNPNNDRPNAITIDNLGNVYVTGEIFNGTNADYGTIKYTPNGEQTIYQLYNGDGNSDDVAKGIEVDASGNVYVTGYSDGGPENNYDIVTLKYNSAGIIVDTIIHNGIYSGDDRAFGIVVNDLGYIYVTGYITNPHSISGRDYITLKYNAEDGTLLWATTFDKGADDEAQAIAVDIRGNVYITGNSYSETTRSDYVTIKYGVVKDVAVRSIISPAGIIDSSIVPIIPIAIVKNNGSEIETFNTVFTIGSYTSTQQITVLYPDESTQVFFDAPPWPIGPRGNYRARCSTYLNGDTFSFNDTLSSSFTIRVRDFSVTNITEPVSLVDSGITITPKAWIHNSGTSNESDSVQFNIVGTSYQSTKLVTLNAGDSVEQVFDAFVVNLPRGKYFVRCSTKLTGDLYENNNLKIDSFIVKIFDVGVVEIISPIGNIDSCNAIEPKVKVKNFGTDDASFHVTLRIGNWSNTQEVIALPPANEETVVFAPWPVGPRGFYTMKCSIRILNDIVSNNDTLSSTFSIIVRDYAATTITPSATTIDSGMTIMLKAWIHNYGSTDESDSVNLYIPNTNYSSTKLVSINAGDSVEVDFDNFVAHVPPNIYIIKCTTRLNGDIIQFNNSTTCLLQVIVPGWRMVESIPIVSRGVKDGGALTTINDTIYALQGANTRNFFRYLPLTNSWSLLKPIPYAVKNDGTTIKKNVKAGAALSVHNNIIYAFKGNNTNEFWAYYPARDSWAQKASIPLYTAISTKSTKVKAGAALATFLDSIYAFKGGNTAEFWVYDVNKDTWHQRKSLIVYEGSQLKKIKAGGALTVNGNRLYAFVGGSTNFFYKYLPGQDTWIKLADALFGTYASIRRKIKDGAALVAFNNKIYALKGGNTQDFGCYDIATNSWTSKETIPLGPLNKRVKAGGALTVAGGQLYAFKGGNSFELWKYSFSTLPEFTDNRALGSTATQSGSFNKTFYFRIRPTITNNYLKVQYYLPTSQQVTIKLYDISGQIIKTLINEYQTPGAHTLKVPTSQLKIPRGVYFIKYQDTQIRQQEKVIITGF